MNKLLMKFRASHLQSFAGSGANDYGCGNDTASSPLLQTRALIGYHIGGNKIHGFAMTKVMWDSIIERVVIKKKDKAVIHFKTGMEQEMTLC